MTRDGNGTNATSQVARWLAVIGALNWGLVGIFDWDLVRAILGNDTGTSASAASRVVYALVGLAGVALAVLSPRRRSSAEPGRLAGAASRS
jgi:MYXO-CTERM domain-containing protein